MLFTLGFTLTSLDLPAAFIEERQWAVEKYLTDAVENFLNSINNQHKNLVVVEFGWVSRWNSRWTADAIEFELSQAVVFSNPAQVKSGELLYYPLVRGEQKVLIFDKYKFRRVTAPFMVVHDLWIRTE